jgi:hypothetical protein
VREPRYQAARQLRAVERLYRLSLVAHAAVPRARACSVPFESGGFQESAR